MAVLGYLPKLKAGLKLDSGAHFLRDISIKMFLMVEKDKKSYWILTLLCIGGRVNLPTPPCQTFFNNFFSLKLRA